MKNYFSVLPSSPLFDGISAHDAEGLLSCLAARQVCVSKGDCLLHTGDRAGSVGLLLSGCVCVQEEDFWGNRNILAKLGPGQIFAESYAAAGAPLRVNVLAEEDSSVLFLDIRKILAVCPTNCGHHNRLIHNLLSCMARRNLMLNEKITHISRRTTRDKLLSYLSAQSLSHGSPEFTIPFDRQQLADYLAVERSAMSAELSRLKQEGVLEFKKSHFILLEEPQA